ncbi:MAG: tetratricopeptide repeat protein [Planctomycetes bacterium]|nr:tetratricopeptide repeat protein [Planctomycetota bacterium]
MRPVSRAILAYLLFATLFVSGAGVLFITCSEAQDPAGNTAKEQPTKPDEGADEGKDEPQLPPPKLDRTPQGPDELFEPLPTEGLFDGVVPGVTYKYVVLRVPNQDSWNDVPDQDLSGSQQAIAAGFELTLDQTLEYLPQLNGELGFARVRRYYAMLRNSDAPRVGSEVKPGQKTEALEAAARTFSAGLVFTFSFKPAVGDAPALGQAVRYRAGEGVEKIVEWEFGKLGKPEADSMVRLAESKIAELTSGIGAAKGENGELIEIPHAPIPRLVAEDKCLRDFQKLRDGLLGGEFTQALISYESIMQRDPTCGRAALYGMEVYRSLSESQTDQAEINRFRHRAIEIGRDALKHNPNDVLIRGRLCWNAGTHFNRFEFAQRGLKEALRVQPASTVAMDWWVTVYKIDDREAQLKWITENALPKVNDGRIHLTLANMYYGSGAYAKGVEWYQKGVEIAPLEFELQLGLGLCATYEAERLSKAGLKRDAYNYYAIAAEALAAAQDIDPQEAGWAYEYYTRSLTRSFTWLPSSQTELGRVFLVQAVLTGLEPTSRTWQWERLVKDIVDLYKKDLRDTCRKAKPGDEHYAMKLMARVRFDVIDKDTDDLILALWTMRQQGLRPMLYNDLMSQFGPLVDEYEPEKKD